MKNSSTTAVKVFMPIMILLALLSQQCQVSYAASQEQPLTNADVVTPMPTPLEVKVMKNPARVIYFGNPYADPVDRLTMGQVSAGLGFSYETQDYTFVNNETNWFDETGQRKFQIIIFGGGHSEKWFEKAVGVGINEMGVANIRKFISQGGSIWAICYSGNSVFAETAVFMEYMGTNQTVTVPGRMVKFHGGDPIFKGTVVGPQESNRPYPRVRFLPIKLNMGNPIVKEANLPEQVYLSTVATPSLIPNLGQSMDVIGWFPSGDAAIAIVEYGEGHLYMVPPHVSQTLEIVLNGQANYIKRWEETEYYLQNGVSKERFEEGKQLLITEGDPDGSTYDLTLAKALLTDAANKAACSTAEKPAAPAFNGSLTGSTLDLSWNAVVGATGYQLYYAPAAFLSPVNSVDMGGATSLVIDVTPLGFPSGARYTGWVVAYNGSCFDSLNKRSNTVTVTFP